MKRGDLVIVDFRFVDPSAGVRPSLIVQNDRDNSRMSKTIIAQVTANISRAGLDTQHLINQSHADWQSSGLRRPSVVNGSSLITIHQQHVLKLIGTLSQATMSMIDSCLNAALGLT